MSSLIHGSLSAERLGLTSDAVGTDPLAVVPLAVGTDPLEGDGGGGGVALARAGGMMSSSSFKNLGFALAGGGVGRPLLSSRW